MGARGGPEGSLTIGWCAPWPARPYGEVALLALWRRLSAYIKPRDGEP
jgi:hypothetical protein